MIGFTGGSRRTTSRLLDPDFPKIRSLFPDQYNARAKLSVAALTEVVKRVALVADRTTPIRLSFAEGEVVVEAGGSEDARASEGMEGEFAGEALTVAFNPNYLLDGLSVLDSPTVLISFTTAMKPAVITPGRGGRRAGSRVPLPDHADARRRLTFGSRQPDRPGWEDCPCRSSRVGPTRGRWRGHAAGFGWAGRMGGNMAARLRAAGHEVVGYDRNPEVSQVAALAELAAALAAAAGGVGDGAGRGYRCSH